MNREDGPAIGMIGSNDFPTVLFHESVGNRQPEPGSSRLGGKKRIEDPVGIGGWQSGAAVPDRTDRFPAVDPGHHRYRSRTRGSLDRVEDEIQDDLSNLLPVDDQSGQAPAEIFLDGNPLAGRLLPGQLDHGSNQVIEIRLYSLGRMGTGEFQVSIHNSRQPVNFLPEDLKKLVFASLSAQFGF